MTDLIDQTLSTERLDLRVVEPKDAPVLSELMSEGISRWVAAWPFPLSPTAAAEIIQTARAAAADGEALPLVAVERPTGRIIGWLKIDITAGSERIVELGYWIAEPAQGRGYALEIAKAAIDFAFSQLGADAVIAGAQVENRASHALLAKLGMTPSDEKPVWAPARQSWETCKFWRLDRS